MNNFNGGSTSLGGYGGMRPNNGFGMKGNSTGGSLRGDIIPKGYKLGQLQQFTPEQIELFQQMFGHVGPESYLSKLAGGDESFFEQMEAPANRQFQGQLGQLASRFSGMGSGGRHGSGFQNTATAAASNFQQDLAANRQNLQRQAIMDLMGLSNQLLGQRPQDRFLAQKPQRDQSSSGWGGLIGAGLGGLAGFLSPVPGGALKGASLGYNVGSGF
jgi:hypothetical protein